MSEASALSISADSGWARTNPVWCLRQLSKQFANPLHMQKSRHRLAKWIIDAQKSGVAFPVHISDAFNHVLPAGFNFPCVTPSPRIVGLLVEKSLSHNVKTGFVNPIIAKPSSDGWFVSPGYLPFSETNVQDAMFQLLRHTGRATLAVPELRGFSLTEQLNEEPRGASMTIAALLAVIDSWNKYTSELFRCGCVIVQPKRDTLEPVASIREKLAGFIREYGHGSLLIRHPESNEADPFHQYFPPQNIWNVTCFGELAEKLLARNHLDAVLKPFPLSLASISDAKRMIRGFTLDKKLDEAVSFAERLERSASIGSPVNLRVTQAIQTELEDLNRHLGRFHQAIYHSSKAVRDLEQLGDLSSTQELVDAKVRLAAALFDGHDFDQGVAILQPHQKNISDNPMLIAAESLVNFNNTLARSKIAIFDTGWEALLHESLRQQVIVDPDSVSRTSCYLIHGLLRGNRLTEASNFIEQVLEGDPDDYTLMFISFYRSELYRRSGGDAGRSYADNVRTEKLGWGHPLGFYLQSTARQENRPLDDRIQRFREAAKVFRTGGDKESHLSLLEFFARLMDLCSDILRQDYERFTIDMIRIQDFLDFPETGKLKDWYQEYIPKTMHEDHINPLLDRVPYF